MSLLSNASDKTDQADLAILAIVETIRDQEQPATSSAVAALIGGAPQGDVSRRMKFLWSLGVLDAIYSDSSNLNYQLTELGVEVMRIGMIGWSPSPREDRRRENELRAMRDNSYYSRMR